MEATFKATVRSISADASKVEVKMLVDLTDVSAHEALVSMRGRDVLGTVEKMQTEMELEG